MTKLVYLAAPFFNESQLAVVHRLEQVVLTAGFDLFSPRSVGVLGDIPPEKRVEHTKRIFDANVEWLSVANVVLAVIDGRDTGTTWEIGFTHGRRSPLTRPSSGLVRGLVPRIVTFTNENHGINIMLQHSIDAHVRGYEEAKRALELLRDDVELGPEFRQFDETRAY